MKKIPDNLHIKAHAGFSLADVMVGMVIALLGMIVIFQVFSVSEGIKRTTTGGGDALQNGTAALFAVERSLRQAGYGVPDAEPPPAANAKLVIVPGAANVSDALVIRSLPGWAFGSLAPNVNFILAVPPALTTETIAVVLTAGGHVQLESSVGGAASAVISDDIVLMKAQYGIDTTVNLAFPDPPHRDCAVDTWTAVAPVAPIDTRDILAVRIAVVARSAQPEKPSVAGGACDATTAFPTWTGGGTLDLSGNFGLAADDDWKCYRYKMFENTVLLRNGRRLSC